MTYKIIKEYRKVNHEGNKNGIIENGLIDKLLLAEIIEGITPIIYSTCIALAFYGPNASIISNVGNTYWSKKIENITPLFSTMFILFAVDTSSVVINFIALWKMMNVNLLHKISQVLEKNRLFFAISLAHKISAYFITSDINVGMGGTREFLWTSHDGWRSLIENSTDLSDEEKTRLLENYTIVY